MTIESALSFTVAVFIFGITPGPGVFAIIAKALVQGARSCFFLSLGMTISDILYLIAACLGLAAIALHWEGIFLGIRIIGAVYLLYLGWRMWTSPVRLPGNTKVKAVRGALMSFIQGFLVSASNPKVILFYIAFLPTFMDLTVLKPHDIALAAFLTLLSLMAGLSLIAYFAVTARRYFETEKGQRSLNRSAGSIMVGAGVFLLLRA